MSQFFSGCKVLPGLSALICRFSVLVVATFASMGSASAESPAQPTLQRPTGSFQSGWLTLEGAGDPYPIFLALRDGQPVQFWSTRVDLPGVPKLNGTPKLLVDGLRRASGDKGPIEVDLRLVSIWAPQARLSQLKLILELNSNSENASGNWQLKVDDKPVGTGKVQGRWKQLSPADSLANGADWSSYHGSESAGRGPAYGKLVIDDLAQARPVWRSEANSLSGWGTGADARYRERAAFGTLCGGTSSLVVGEGMVYLYHYLPSGDGALTSEDQAVVAKYAAHPSEHDAMRRWYSQHADLVVTAMHGATGQTVWQSVWPQKQGNYQTHKWRGLNPTPCLSKGVLAVADYGFGLHAYEARTGELLWSRAGTDVIRKDNAPLGPVIAGNVIVLVTPEKTLGLDLRTGEQRWTAVGGVSARKVQLAGRERVLVVGSHTALIDPLGGQVLWTSAAPTQDKLNLAGAMPICADDKVLFYEQPDPKASRGSVVAYSLSDAGMTRVWRNEPVGEWDENLVMTVSGGRVFVAHQAGLREVDLATGKTVQTVAELTCGSNANLVSFDQRLLYQPEGQHGRQSIHMLDATAGSLRILSQNWHPPHNHTTAYAVMALTNVVVDGRLLLRGMDGLYCYDLRPGK